MGQSWFDILHPEDLSKIKEQLLSSDVGSREKSFDMKSDCKFANENSVVIVTKEVIAYLSFFYPHMECSTRGWLTKPIRSVCWCSALILLPHEIQIDRCTKANGHRHIAESTAQEKVQLGQKIYGCALYRLSEIMGTGQNGTKGAGNRL